MVFGWWWWLEGPSTLFSYVFLSFFLFLLYLFRSDLHPAVRGGWLDRLATLGHPDHIHVPTGRTSKVVSEF